MTHTAGKQEGPLTPSSNDEELCVAAFVLVHQSVQGLDAGELRLPLAHRANVGNQKVVFRIPQLCSNLGFCVSVSVFLYISKRNSIVDNRCAIRMEEAFIKRPLYLRAGSQRAADIRRVFVAYMSGEHDRVCLCKRFSNQTSINVLH